MELSFKTIQQMNDKEIYDFFLPTINGIYQTYEYVGISPKKYYELVLKEIIHSKKTYTGDIFYGDFLIKNIETILFKYVRKLIYDSATSFKIINNYINYKFSTNLTYENAMKYFTQLDAFLKHYDFIPNVDELMKLINENNIFIQMIELIFKCNKSQIILGNSEKIFDNTLLISTIETYCIVNSIEIKQESLEENYDQTEVEMPDSVVVYLREVGRRPLLSIQQERELAKKVAQGDIKARELFIESNLKLVVSIARKYLNRGLPFLDLIQEGNLGLMTAVDKYDIEKGCKFSTYAAHWIRRSITQAIYNKGRNIRMPVHIHEKIGIYRRVLSKLENKLNRQPTITEIAKEMNLSISEVIKLSKLQNDTVSLSTLIGDVKDTELEYFIPASDETVEDMIIIKLLSSDIRKLFEACNLTSREIKILMLRYGFDDMKPMSLKQLGTKFNITRQRIDQIEKQAFMKIRKSKYIQEFAQYMQHPKKSLENIEEFREGYRKLKISSKKDNERVKVKEKKTMQKLQSIYEYFKDYTREQVDEMLSKLDEEDKELITLRYGDDLDNPVQTQLTKEKRNKFYGILLPKMKKILANPYGEYSKRNRKTKSKQTFFEQQSQDVETEVEDKKEEPTQDVKKEPNNGITKNDCIKMLELLRTPTFTQMLSMLTVKEAIIISLKLGYVDGKYFSTESIAKFLSIEEIEVIETTKKLLLLYKDNINDFLDNIIEVATDQINEGRVLTIEQINQK